MLGNSIQPKNGGVLMSKVAKAAKKQYNADKIKTDLRLDEAVTNFMGGDSYVVNPLDTLKMVSASSIFGEPAFYRDSKLSSHSYDYVNDVYNNAYSCGILGDLVDFQGGVKTTDEVMTEVIDNALDYDFEGTLHWAVELRKKYYMRLNPQVILVRAAIHPGRKEFNEKHPGEFREIVGECMMRGDDSMSGLAYFLYINDGKSNMPSVLKRTYADHLSRLNRYSVAKYKNSEIGMIDAVRICHAHSKVLDELMKEGTVEVDDTEATWEKLRSQGKSWMEVFQTVNMGHMALLRNLRGFFAEVRDTQARMAYLNKLKSGVLNGKQFPFRYYSAYIAVKDSFVDSNGKELIKKTLEECMRISLDNTPKLKGKTAILTDNSGSAWGAFNSEFGSVVIAEINNLSAVITAMNSDEGTVYAFGDRLLAYPIDKSKGILEQAEMINKDADHKCGMATEGGIWEFFRDSMNNKTYWDNIFIYSDQQAGTGGLYGTSNQQKEYYQKYGVGRNYINVFKLVIDYRRRVNSKVNVFSVQTAGYDNAVLPQYAYRTNLMYGWTGKELVFAKAIISQWDELDAENRV
jgi:hypothetical protein